MSTESKKEGERKILCSRGKESIKGNVNMFNKNNLVLLATDADILCLYAEEVLWNVMNAESL